MKHLACFFAGYLISITAIQANYFGTVGALYICYYLIVEVNKLQFKKEEIKVSDLYPPKQ